MFGSCSQKLLKQFWGSIVSRRIYFYVFTSILLDILHSNVWLIFYFSIWLLRFKWLYHLWNLNHYYNFLPHCYFLSSSHGNPPPSTTMALYHYHYCWILIFCYLYLFPTRVWVRPFVGIADYIGSALLRNHIISIYLYEPYRIDCAVSHHLATLF